MEPTGSRVSSWCPVTTCARFQCPDQRHTGTPARIPQPGRGGWPSILDGLARGIGGAFLQAVKQHVRRCAEQHDGAQPVIEAARVRDCPCGKWGLPVHTRNPRWASSLRALDFLVPGRPVTRIRRMPHRRCIREDTPSDGQLASYARTNQALWGPNQGPHPGDRELGCVDTELLGRDEGSAAVHCAMRPRKRVGDS